MLHSHLYILHTVANDMINMCCAPSILESNRYKYITLLSVPSIVSVCEWSSSISVMYKEQSNISVIKAPLTFDLLRLTTWGRVIFKMLCSFSSVTISVYKPLTVFCLLSSQVEWEGGGDGRVPSSRVTSNVVAPALTYGKFTHVKITKRHK